MTPPDRRDRLPRGIRFAALVVVVAGVSWLAAAGVGRMVRSNAPPSAEDPVKVSVESFDSILAAADLPRRELATFWVHPECVACFHYLGSILSEAGEHAARGVQVLFVVMGREKESRDLTRLIPTDHRVAYDPTGRLFESTGVTITPQFIHFGPDGTVLRHGRGPTAWGSRPLDPEAPEPAITGTEVPGPG